MTATASKHAQVLAIKKSEGKIRLENAMKELRAKQASAGKSRQLAKEIAGTRLALEKELKDELKTIKLERLKEKQLKSSTKSEDKEQMASFKKVKRLQEFELIAAKKKAEIAKAKLEQAKAEQEAAKMEAEAISARDEAKRILEELKVIKAKVIEERARAVSFMSIPTAVAELKVKTKDDATLVSELTGNADLDHAADNADNAGYGVEWNQEKGFNMNCGDGGFEEMASSFLKWFMGDEEETSTYCGTPSTETKKAEEKQV